MKPPERQEPGPIDINNAYKGPTCLSISTTDRRKRCESRLTDEIWSYYEMCLSTTSQVMPIILGTFRIGIHSGWLMKRQRNFLLLFSKKRRRSILDFCSTLHQGKVEDKFIKAK